MSKITCAKKFIKCQGYPAELNAIFQDNASTMKLLDNGKVSSGKQTGYFDIRLFCFTILIKGIEVTVKYFPTEMMLADCMSKPLVGTKSRCLETW